MADRGEKKRNIKRRSGVNKVRPDTPENVELKRTDKAPDLYAVTKAAVVTKNLLESIPIAKKAASRWKHYVTKKRRLVCTGPSEICNRSSLICPYEESTATASTVIPMDANGGNAEGSLRTNAKNGQGLDEIDQVYVARSKVNTAASNRALIQYFAKLGQSSGDEEQLDLDFVEGLIKQGADINCTDKYGQTLLHEAARMWHCDVAKFLLEHGAKINHADNYGRTALHVAAAVDYADMCQFLIDHDANKEAVTKGEKQTPLFYAARNDATKALAVLIKAGCEYKTVRDYRGRTPIYVAAELDRSETARCLLECQAPVGVEDNWGQPALTQMINKMGPVAREALDQLHSVDRANRKQYFYLQHLEPLKPDEQRKGYAKMPLEVLVALTNYDLVLHPVISEMIKVKWNQFGKFGAVRLLVLNSIFIALWTTISLHSPWYSKCSYVIPDEIWKMVIYIVAVGLTVYQIVDELMEFYKSQKEHLAWKSWRLSQLEEDIKYCHPRWPEEKAFLENEKKDLDKFKSHYFSDFWNIFDWICYTFLLASTVSHLVDVFVFDKYTAIWHNRIMAVNIILVWLRTMKYVRCFSALGPFIVILGEMVTDMGRFAFIYILFLIPFSCAFWMLFGGDHTGVLDTVDNTTAACVVANLEGFSQPNIKWMTLGDELVFSLFRLTVVDEYDLDGMLATDKGMTYLLLGLWLGISAIIALNFFIALLSDTFQRVYDNAKANAVMQKAITVLNIEDKLRASRLYQYRQYIAENCSPEVLYYDDDTGEESDELKKVTIQVKERLDEMYDLWHMKYGSPVADYDHSDDEGTRWYPEDEAGDAGEGEENSSSGGGDGLQVKKALDKTRHKHTVTSDQQNKTKTVTSEKLENEVDILRAELVQVEKKRRDFEKKCLSEIDSIKNLIISQQQMQQQSQHIQYHSVPPLNLSGGYHTSYLPPAYPAVIGERTTPREDQMRGGASVSNVDISTLPEEGSGSSLPGYRQ